MENHIHCQQYDGILEIQFARPAKKNALTNAMYHEAQQALEQAKNDDCIKVIIFTAQGDFFTAGNDLQDFLEVSESNNSDLKALDFIKSLGDYPKPLIAAVTGSAVGIGTTMLLHCDLVYILDTAKLLAPFVNLALVPEAASSLLLTQRIGHTRAFAMFALGEAILGKEAVTLGIANQSFATAEEVLNIAHQKATLLASKSSEAVRHTKRLMRETETILARMQLENACISERLKSDESKQILKGFFAKK